MNQDSIKIQQLKHRYKNSLGEKLEDLDGHLLAVGFDASGVHTRLDELHEYLHKLAGSAGMYGYDDIAQSAREAMVLTTPHTEPPSSAAIKQAIGQLRQLLEQHA